MYIVVLVAAGNKKEARKIASALVKEKLAACVNILDKAESFFFWEGKLNRAQESLLIIKSKKSKLAQIIKRVKSLHSYTVPEIISLPVSGGLAAYLRWVDESVR